MRDGVDGLELVKRHGNRMRRRWRKGNHVELVPRVITVSAGVELFGTHLREIAGALQ